MGNRRHNPERRAWRHRSYRKGGEAIADLKQEPSQEVDDTELCPNCGGEGYVLGRLGVLWHYRCRGCGSNF